MSEIKPKKSLLDIIDDLSELLKESHNFHEVIFNGDKTNIRISKPDKKEESE
ncbi:MAG: hypothetical protein M0R17_04805 [Candidatus Omnitrophica bacterium]|jgi:hypothetical protein|nr:hypothetical protein [Candidatus Omnitrophota bacterium]